MTAVNAALIRSINSEYAASNTSSINKSYEWSEMGSTSVYFCCIFGDFSFMISVRRVVTSSPRVLTKCSKTSKNISPRAEQNFPNISSITTSWTGADNPFQNNACSCYRVTLILIYTSSSSIPVPDPSNCWDLWYVKSKVR